MLTIVQNDPEVPAGAYAAYLKEAGVPFRIVKPFSGEELPSASGVSAVIILGGGMGAHETGKHPFLLDVKGFIREAAALEKPFLGICLGGQMLAEVCGGRVIAGSPHGEKGTLQLSLTPDGIADPIFSGIDQGFPTFQWHNDSFEIPAAAVLLAYSVACPNQAFRLGKNAYGIQFHPEVDGAIVETWASWTEATAPFAAAFLKGFNQAHVAYAAASHRLLLNFLHIAELA